MIQQTLIPRAIEVESREPVLAIDDQEAGLRNLQIAYRLVLPQRPELQYVFGQEKNSAGDGGVGLGGLVKVDDLPDLAPAHQTLERLYSWLAGPDECPDG